MTRVGNRFKFNSHDESHGLQCHSLKEQRSWVGGCQPVASGAACLAHASALPEPQSGNTWGCECELEYVCQPVASRAACLARQRCQPSASSVIASKSKHRVLALPAGGGAACLARQRCQKHRTGWLCVNWNVCSVTSLKGEAGQRSHSGITGPSLSTSMRDLPEIACA